MREWRLLHEETQVLLGCATDVCTRILAELDAALAILVNHVASDVWLAAGSRTVDSVVAALSDPVLPNVGKAAELVTLACAEDSIRMALLNQVLEKLRLVIHKLNAYIVQTEFVLDNLETRMRGINLRRHQRRLRL